MEGLPFVFQYFNAINACLRNVHLTANLMLAIFLVTNVRRYAQFLIILDNNPPD